MNEKKRPDDRYLTPTEILNEFPRLKEVGWNLNAIGCLRRIGVLRARKIPGFKGYEISLTSLKEVLSTINENRKLDF